MFSIWRCILVTNKIVLSPLFSGQQYRAVGVAEIK